MGRVFQLRAVGNDSTGIQRKIYSPVVYSTEDIAKERLNRFHTAVIGFIENPTVTVVPIDVITDESNMLPKSYVPSAYGPPEIKKRNEVVYGAGYEEQPGSFGMFDGPTPHLLDVLESVPCGVNPCIIRFNLDGSDTVLYRWSDIDHSWKLQNV